MYSQATPISFAPTPMDYVHSEVYSNSGTVYYQVTEPAYDPNRDPAHYSNPDPEYYSYPDVEYYPGQVPECYPDPVPEYCPDSEIEYYSYSDVEYYPDQVPECCPDTAPAFYSDPAPQYYPDSIPEYFSAPALAYYPVPVPTYCPDDVPVYFPAPAPEFLHPCYQPAPVACSPEPSSSVSFSPSPSSSSCSIGSSQDVNRQSNSEASYFDFDLDLNMMTLAHGGTLSTRVYREKMQRYHKEKWATGSSEYDQLMVELNRERNLYLDDNVLDLHYLPLALALNELNERIETLRAGQRASQLFVCTGKGNNSRQGSLTIKEDVLRRAAAAGIQCSVAPENEGWLIIALQSHY